jgi:hypothetical protein
LNKAIVWLDVDLEFHAFPTLFAPFSWSDGPRDVRDRRLNRNCVYLR